MAGGRQPRRLCGHRHGFSGGSAGTTPLPGTLPLLGSVLGGGLLFRRFRKRGKSQIAAA